MTVNKQLESWIKDGLKKGYSIDELRKKALEKYPEKTVNDTIKKISGKSKFVWIIAVVVLAGLIFAAYYLFIIKSLQSAPSEEQIQTCIAEYPEAPAGYARAFCLDRFYSEKALNTSNSKYCEKIIEESLRQRCFDIAYYSLAVSQQKKEICEKITDSLGKEECISRIK